MSLEGSIFAYSDREVKWASHPKNTGALKKAAIVEYGGPFKEKRDL